MIVGVTGPEQRSRHVVWQRAAAGHFVDLPTGKRAATYAWTTKSALRRGDLSLLYANGRQEFVGIGRLLCDPVEADLGDGGWWTFLQVLGAKHPVGRDKTGLAAARGEFTDLTARPADVARVLAAFRHRDPDLVERFERWRTERPPALRAYEPEDLRWSERAEPAKDAPPPGGELAFQGEIEGFLTESGVARPIEPRDGINLSAGHHLVERAGGFGFADLVLLRPRTASLMLIEVKLHARFGPAADGISQIRRYRPALRQVSDPSWRIESYVIAKRFVPSVGELAKVANVVMLQWHDGDPPRLEFHAGRRAPAWLKRLPR